MSQPDNLLNKSCISSKIKTLMQINKNRCAISDVDLSPESVRAPIKVERVKTVSIVSAIVPPVQADNKAINCIKADVYVQPDNSRLIV